MFPPNTDANTGDNPAYHCVNLIADFKREWKEDSKASTFIIITANRTGRTTVKFLESDFHHSIQIFSYSFSKL
jgi:hypothetical protein